MGKKKFWISSQEENNHKKIKRSHSGKRILQLFSKEQIMFDFSDSFPFTINFKVH